ncbi:MAG: cytochrome b5 domain-containing protein [Desulfuromonadales bacterium]|nr:cytochrome b5 domain-containing protein [Desulfuromonadales bacterium]
MTAEELARFNGKDGQPAYVAVNNVLYDVSASAMWQNGNHLDQHQAGCDLTEELKSAPHVRKVIERFPTVGRLEEKPEPAAGSSAKPVLIVIGLLLLGLIGWLVLY